MAYLIKKLPSTKYLRECFTYNPKTGDVHWKHRPLKHFVDEWHWKSWNARFAGVKITSKHNGYYRAAINRRRYSLHRVIWKLITNKEPPVTIDHKNGNRLDNRLVNLRAATKRQQLWNKHKREQSSSGYRGVNQVRGRWRARIKVNGVQRHIDYFSSPAEASAAYQAAAKKLHGEFYRG